MKVSLPPAVTRTPKPENVIVPMELVPGGRRLQFVEEGLGDVVHAWLLMCARKRVVSNLRKLSLAPGKQGNARKFLFFNANKQAPTRVNYGRRKLETGDPHGVREFESHPLRQLSEAWLVRGSFFVFGSDQA
jgi:hypothetical protein